MNRTIQLLLALFLVTSPAYAGTVTFESQSDTAAVLNSVGSPKVTSGVAGGLSGSLGGQIDSQFTNNTLPTINGFSAGSANPIFSVSIYFQFLSPTSSAGGAMISLGLTNSGSTDVFASSASRSIAGIQKSSFATSYSPYNDSKVNGSGGGSSGGATFNFVDGSWYQLSLNAAFNTTNGHYALQFNVNNSDSQGTLGTSLYTTTFTDLLTTSNYTSGVHPFVAFSGPAGQMGVGIVDNFSVPVAVPEPKSTVFLVAGALLVVLWRTRRVSLLRRL